MRTLPFRFEGQAQGDPLSQPPSPMARVGKHTPNHPDVRVQGPGPGNGQDPVQSVPSLDYSIGDRMTEFCENRVTPWMWEVMNIPKDRYLSIASVRRRLREVTAMGNARFRKWNTPEELAKPAVWVASKKYPLRLSRDSALAQCLTEHLLHLGEVEAVLWQMDVEPPTTFWIARRVLHGKWPPPKSALMPGARDWAARHTVESKRPGGAKGK